MEENELVKAIKEDSSQAFEELFNKLYPSLVNHAIRFVKEKEFAEEIVQDSFVAFWNKRKELMITTSLSGYLYQIVRNRCLNYLKSKNYKDMQLLTQEMYVESSQDSISESLDEHDLVKIIDAAIQSLPEKTHLFFNLSREEDLSYKEIGEKLSVSVKTVEYHVSRALKVIRKALEQHWYIIFITFLI